ncbi:SPOR domain-containing protein [Qipengyuania sp. JC766]|uniref:SPOR domain-containing protein n=1 Tax=Qipengyuania sp. JC766 TaxID=3232139 RepID=UPI00345A404F
MTGAMDERDDRDEEYLTSYETLRDGDDANGDADGETELEFDTEDESLPWLESSEYDEESGPDTARVIAFVLIGLIALAAILGAVWWLSNRGPDPDLVADGSTIEAPEGPVKSRPEDAGGKEFEGSGQVAPGVGEGKTTEGRLAEGNSARPSIDAEGSQRPEAAEGEASGSGGIGVQLGAYSRRERAVEAWEALVRRSDTLSGRRYRVEEATVDGATVFRLQAVAGDNSDANRLCTALKSEGIECQVKG